MFKELIDAIQSGVKPESIKINGREFATAQVFEAEPRIAKSLKTATLQSIVDYLENDIDGLDERGRFIHVESPVRVSIQQYLDETNRREERLAAEFEPHNFAFGKELDQSSFITLLRSQFVETDARLDLQKFVGTLIADSSLKLEDDGISQKTVAKTGITTVSTVENSSPLVLAPFRTFSEIEQPESEFILRLHKRDGDVPRISLHEADNQAWKNEAIQRIAEWLRTAEVKIPILA